MLDSEISADGHSKVPVLAIGANDDGTPATEQVVLATSRASAGTFDHPSPTLGAFGASVYFTPCNAATSGCTGPVDFTLALASDAANPVSTLPVTLVGPMGVGSPEPCLVGGNVMFFDGNDYIYNGTMTVTQGMFAPTGDTDTVEISVIPFLTTQGTNWAVRFSSAQLNVPLTPGVYENAVRLSGSANGHAGLEVIGDGRGCNTIAGRFQIEDYTITADTVSSLTATFEQHCEGGAPVLNGCIHYEAP